MSQRNPIKRLPQFDWKYCTIITKVLTYPNLNQPYLVWFYLTWSIPKPT